MTKKQLLVLVLSIIVGGSLTVAGMLTVYKVKPEYLGIKVPRDSTDSTGVQIDSTEIKAELERLRREQQVQKERDSLAGMVARLTDSVLRLDQVANERADSVKQFRLKLAEERNAQVRRRDSTARANLEIFAKIYDTAAPQDVAAILQNLDDRDAAIILKLMKKKNAARVLEAMDPERAASIMVLSYTNL